MSGNWELEREFREYEAWVLTYSRYWWRTDPRAREVFAVEPGRRDAAERVARDGTTVETVVIHGPPPDTWLTTREALQRSVVAERCETATQSPRPTLVLVIGVPGSGKTSALRRVALKILDAREPFVIDADDIRASLPEFRGGRGSLVLQFECAYVTYGALYQAALATGADVLIDTIGRSDYLMEYVRQFRERGYRVFVLCSSLDIQLARQRVIRRAVTNGRYVPLGVLDGAEGRPLSALRELLGSELELDGWAVLDTDVGPDEAPIVVEGDGTFGVAGEPSSLW